MTMTTQTKKILVCFVTLATMLASTVVLAEPTHIFGELNPEAPSETAQFSFIVGEWSCEIRSMKPDGSDGAAYSERSALWTGYYILDGWAIQDDWVSQGPDGQMFYGTNIRSFNSLTKKWNNRWLPAGTLQWKYYESEMIGDTMVMTGGEGTDPRGNFIDRNTFFSIKPDSWSWRKDRSFDGGATWTEGIASLKAKRIE